MNTNNLNPVYNLLTEAQVKGAGKFFNSVMPQTETLVDKIKKLLPLMDTSNPRVRKIMQEYIQKSKALAEKTAAHEKAAAERLARLGIK